MMNNTCDKLHGTELGKKTQAGVQHLVNQLSLITLEPLSDAKLPFSGAWPLGQGRLAHDTL